MNQKANLSTHMRINLSGSNLCFERHLGGLTWSWPLWVQGNHCVQDVTGRMLPLGVLALVALGDHSEVAELSVAAEHAQHARPWGEVSSLSGSRHPAPTFSDFNPVSSAMCFTSLCLGGWKLTLVPTLPTAAPSVCFCIHLHWQTGHMKGQMNLLCG